MHASNCTINTFKSHLNTPFKLLFYYFSHLNKFWFIYHLGLNYKKKRLDQNIWSFDPSRT